MLKQILKNEKAFTFVEAIVVIVLIGITVLIWGFYGRGNVKTAMLTEGKMLIEKIVAQEKEYYAEKSNFLAVGETSSKPELYIDLAQNKYFTKFSVSVSGNNLTIKLKVNTSKYSDMSGYNVTGIYQADKDIIKYAETHGG